MTLALSRHGETLEFGFSLLRGRVERGRRTVSTSRLHFHLRPSIVLFVEVKGKGKPCQNQASICRKGLWTC